MTPEWKKHLEETRFMQSKPDPRTGEVAVYRHCDDGELRYERTERPSQSPDPSSLR